MSQAKKRKTAGPTILDYLNEDCWKCVLDYLDLEDVIISELVSRRWQAVVLTYMQTVRVALNDDGWSSPAFTPWPRVRWLELEYEEWPLFERWAKKLGSTVVFAFCSTEKQLDIIRKHCPNVESLTIARFKGPIILNYKNKSFKRLQKLRFEHCNSVTDRCVSQFINTSITELEIDDDEEDFKIKGQFLNSVKSKLKSLALIKMGFRLNYLLSDWLSELKKLHLSDVPESIFKNIHLVFDKTPQLEDLHLYLRYRGLNGLDVSKLVSRLGNLQHLSGSVVSTDEDLEAVTRGCKELRFLKIVESTVSVRGLRAMCLHAGTRLVKLSIGSNSKLTDDDMVVCVRGCTTLTELDVSGCSKLTERLRPLAEEARREMRPRPPPLRIRRAWSGIWMRWIIVE